MSKSDLMLMGEFFDYVSVEYDEVHTSHIDGGKEYYEAFSIPVAETSEYAILRCGWKPRRFI